MKTIISIITTSLISLSSIAQTSPFDKYSTFTKVENPIQVLNVGTFHMGYSTDANTVDFDEHNKDNVKQIHQIAKKIAEFKPTIIIVETPPLYNNNFQQEYNKYLKNPKIKFENPNEIQLLAYEVGRLANTQRIYGIDHKMEYNYRIGDQIKDSKDQKIVNWYYQKADSLDKVFEASKPSVLDRLLITNQPFYLDFLINANADMLTHIATEGNFEGADEATKYYQRNLRMYSNLNQISINKDDRIFILMGASHTAFFKLWLERSPKYKLVNTFDYL